MIWKLLHEEVAKYWEFVKYTCVNTPPLPEDRKQSYANEILAKLLTDRVQCWFVLTSDRRIKMCAITEIEEVRGEKRVTLLHTYGFAPSVLEDRKDLISDIETFARNIGASKLVTESYEPAVDYLLEQLGSKQVSRTYIKEVRI